MSAKIEVRKVSPTETADGAICLQCSKSPDAATWARHCRGEWLRQRMTRGLDLFVAYSKTQPVGFVEAEPMNIAGWEVKDLYWLSCMYVAPEVRGKGVGDELLRTIEVDAAHRSRGLYTTGKFGTCDLARFLLKHQYQPTQANGDTLYGRLFRGAPEPLRRKPKEPPRNRPLPDPKNVLVELYWSAACAMCAYDSFVLQRVCTQFGNRVRLHSICQDEPTLVAKYGGAPGYAFIDGVEPPLYHHGQEDPNAVRQAIWQALRAKKLV